MVFRTWRDVDWPLPTRLEKVKETFLGGKCWFVPPKHEFEPEYEAYFAPDPQAPDFIYEIAEFDDGPYFVYQNEAEFMAAQGTYIRPYSRSFRAPIWASGLNLDQCLSAAQETDSRDKAEIYLRQASMLDPSNPNLRIQISVACQFGHSAPQVLENLHPEAKLVRGYLALYDAIQQAEFAMIIEGYDGAESTFQFAFANMQMGEEATAFEYAARALSCDPNHEGANWLLEVAKYRPRRQ